jgi:hypothetical protein
LHRPFHFSNKREAEIESSGPGGRRGLRRRPDLTTCPAPNLSLTEATDDALKKARPETGHFASSSGFGLLIDSALGDLG